MYCESPQFAKAISRADESCNRFWSFAKMCDKRLQQVLMNLLSNAFKFTEVGKVFLSVDMVARDETYHLESLSRASDVIAFSVSDTGIGIPAEKQRIIFEPFQQADGTTTRRYGGTGLGLSISREIARLLGGEIRVVSTPGEGSTFTFFLPRNYVPAGATTAATNQKRPRPSVSETAAAWTPLDTLNSEAMALLESESAVVQDDRHEIQSGDRTVLIVEDDINFAGILLDLAREKGFKGLVATGGTLALVLARSRRRRKFPRSHSRPTPPKKTKLGSLRTVFSFTYPNRSSPQR